MKNKDFMFTSICNQPMPPLRYVHDTYFIYQYTDEHIKDLILDSKNLEDKALWTMGNILYRGIYAHVLNIYSSKTDTNPHDILTTKALSHSKHISILILHAPSSSFAIGNKTDDHMARIAEYLISIAESCRDRRQYPEPNINIDSAPFTFIHTLPPKTSQHHKSRALRLADQSKRFHITRPIPHLVLNQYTHIYIIDDVLTTGSTLNTLKELLTVYCSQYKDYPSIYTFAFCH